MTNSDEPQKPYTGKAYAFFNCNATPEVIEAEIPNIRRLVRTPTNLELSLTENTGLIKGDRELQALAEEAKTAGLKYILTAKCPKKDNRETAQELTGILNQAYQSPLYQKDEPFSGDVLYRHRSRYVSM